MALLARIWAISGYIVVTQKDFSPGKIEVVNVETGNRTTIDDYGMGPVFSPDGGQVAYSKNNKISIKNSDGSGSATIIDVSCPTGKEPCLSWIELSGAQYLYWSEQSGAIYRVRIGASEKEKVHNSSDKLYMVSVSADGKKAACSKPSWSAWAIDIGGGERSLGGGCQATVSPNGKYVTHNLSGHKKADIHDHASKSVVKTITCPTGEFNMHRFSHHSNDWVVFTVNGNKAYICDWKNNKSYAVGSGAPYDYFPGSIDMTNPRIALSKSEITFTGELGKLESSPASATITVTNSGAGTLDKASVSGAPSWLHVSIDNSDPNNQALIHSVDATALNEEKTYTADMSVTVANASPATASYTVSFVVSAQPVFSAIAITPASASVQPGESVQFSAEALDQHGNPMPAQPSFTWTVNDGGSMSNGTFTAGDEKGGPYTVTASAAVEGVTKQATAEVIIADFHLKVNCGSNSYDVAGWERDDPYLVSGGSDYSWKNAVDVSGVANAAPADVYRSVVHTNHTYRFANVPNGSYTLRLHLADEFENRDMTYKAEGVTILENFDIVTEAGGKNKALVKDFPVAVSDGNGLELQCTHASSDVFECGIEIIGATVAEPLVITSPNGGETLSIGQTIAITWQADCNALTGIELHISPDNGRNWLQIDASGTVNCGGDHWESYPWTIPEQIGGVSLASNTCLLRLKEYNGAAEAVSEAVFTIEAAGSTRLDPMHSSALAPVRIQTARGALRITARGGSSWHAAIVDARGVVQAEKKANNSAEMIFTHLPAGMYLVTISGIGKQQCQAVLVVE
jgi:plastocyanin